MFSSTWQIFVVLISLISSLPSCYGIKSKVGSVFGLYAEQNRRNKMEDFSVRIENVFGTGFYAILDGHRGIHSSSYAKKFLTKAVKNVLRSNHSDHGNSEHAKGLKSDLNWPQMLTNFTDQMEAHLKTRAENGKEDSGTTCLMVVAEKNKLTVGNVGDSRGVMCDSNSTAINLSDDHKARRNVDEEERVIRANNALRGRIDGRVCGLAITRTLGDFDCKRMAGQNVIISKPEISQFDLIEYKPKFMILASDGLWDKLSSQEAVDHIKDCYLNETDFGAKSLAKRAIKSGSKDNITVLVVAFDNDGTYKVSTSVISKMQTISRKVSNCLKIN